MTRRSPTTPKGTPPRPDESRTPTSAASPSLQRLRRDARTQLGFWRAVQRRACADAFLDVTVKPDQTEIAFDAFVRADGQRLRRAMTSQYGVDIGCESTDAAMAWAWEHWDRLRPMANPAGYLYRVAQTQARRAISRGRPVTFPNEPSRATEPGSPSVDSALAQALRQLPERQRVAVLLVHVYGWTPTEVGEITGAPAVTVRSHLRRGLRQLRTSLLKGSVQ